MIVYFKVLMEKLQFILNVAEHLMIATAHLLLKC